MLKRIFYLVLSLCFIMVSCENPVDTETVKVTVSYDTNGATSGVAVVDTTMYEEGAVLTVADNSGELAKTGYSFTGWSTTATGEAVNTVIIGTENITLYAAWTLLPTFTVTYDLDGATTGSISPATYDTGTTVTVPAQGELLKAGCTFDGWLIDTTITTSFEITEDVTLKVNWIVIPPAMTNEDTIDFENLIKANVTMSNVNHPDGTLFIAAGDLKGDDGTVYNWTNNSADAPSYFSGTIDAGELSFTIYVGGSATDIDFKILVDGTWDELVNDNSGNILLPLTGFTSGDEIDVTLDCTNTDTTDIVAADYTMATIGTVGAATGVYRKVVFNINNLPASFEGDELALAGEGVLTRDLSDRSWWTDGIVATVSSNTASFTYYTAEESTRFRILTSGAWADRLQDSRSTDGDLALIIDLTEFATDTTVTIEWDASTSWSIITED